VVHPELYAGRKNRHRIEDSMIFTPAIKKAIVFSIKTHEVYQKQKRKGKDIAYITHPLTVGVILARASTNEDVIVAGILHDTIEDSIDKKKVTRAMIAERFGKNVADLVDSVAEQRKDLDWESRKREALEHIRTFSHDSLLVKSADVISNVSEIIEDYRKEGPTIFRRFNAPKEKVVRHYLETMETISIRWLKTPFADDLSMLIKALKEIERWI
jgi:(p)ppGpp synthase/HD superfamily hydrolase